MDRLFISTKDRPTELTILCKSLLHSDMHKYIAEVIFLDDHSEDIITIGRIFSSFSYLMLSRGVRCRFIEAKDGREGINDSWDRIKYYPTQNIWMLNGDMMVFPNYFKENKRLLDWATSVYRNKSIIVSGFNTTFHPPINHFYEQNAIQTQNFGGCSCLTSWNNLKLILECLGKSGMKRGWDLHIGEVFDLLLVTNPTQSQHLGILTGLNQISLAGFPGAFANIGVKQ